MNQKISKGMFVKIHPKICRKKIPRVLSDKMNYTFINSIKDSSPKVIDLFYKCVHDSTFYEFLVNNDNQEMVQFRTQFNMNSTLTYRSGYKCILMAQLELKNESSFRFQLPVCFLIESFDVPLSIY